MAAFIAQNLAPIMFGALVIFLLLGYPVAFSLAANGLLFFFIAVELAPAGVLAPMAKRSRPDLEVRSLRTPDDLLVPA